MQQKYKQKGPPEVVRIQKLRTNYELRYGFNKKLTEYIKTLPKEHWKTRVDSFTDQDGNVKEDWVRAIREIEIGNVISFLLDNSMPFKLENLMPDESQRLVREYKERQERINKIVRAKVDGIDISGEDYSMFKVPPFDYQKKAIKFFEMNGGVGILGDQPGIGKSYAAFGYAIKNKLRTLVVCPSAVKTVWRDQILKFTNEKAFVFKQKTSKKNPVKNPPKDSALIHIINYESLATYIKLQYKHKCSGKKINLQTKERENCNYEFIDENKAYKECPICKNKNTIKSKLNTFLLVGDKQDVYLDNEAYDLIILDECHRIKESKTNWTQVIKTAFQDTTKNKLLLSGTAIKNRPIEFFTPLNFMDKEDWNSRHDFAKRYCAAYEDTFGWDYNGASNLEELYERISPLYLRRLKKDVLPELPEKTFTDIIVEFDDKEEKEYRKLEKGEEGEDEKSFLAQVHKLKQFTEIIKLKRCEETVLDIVSEGEKIVIFFDYIKTGQEIMKMFGEEICVLHTGEMNENDRYNSVQKFQTDKKVKIIGGTIMSMGVGLDLTAASKLIFVGQAWSNSDMIQCEDRIHRASTTHENIQIIKYLCEDTIDMDIHKMLKEKAQIVSKVLDNVDYSQKVTKGDQSILKDIIQKLRKKS